MGGKLGGRGEDDDEGAADDADPASLIEGGSPIDFSPAEAEDFWRLKLPLRTTVTETSLTFTKPLLIPFKLMLLVALLSLRRLVSVVACN